MENVIITPEQMQVQISLLIKSCVLDTKNISLVDLMYITDLIHKATRDEMINIYQNQK